MLSAPTRSSALHVRICLLLSPAIAVFRPGSGFDALGTVTTIPPASCPLDGRQVDLRLERRPVIPSLACYVRSLSFVIISERSTTYILVQFFQANSHRHGRPGIFNTDQGSHGSIPRLADRRWSWTGSKAANGCETGRAGIGATGTD